MKAFVYSKNSRSGFLKTLICSFIFSAFTFTYVNAQTTIYSQNFSTLSAPEWTLNATEGSPINSAYDTLDNNHWDINNNYTGYTNTKVSGANVINTPTTSEPNPGGGYMHITAGDDAYAMAKVAYPSINSSGVYSISGSTFASLLTIPLDTSYDAWAYVTKDNAANIFTGMNTDVSTVGDNGVSFNFWWLCGGSNAAGGDHGLLCYSTNSGATWTILSSTLYHNQPSTWQQANVTNSAFNNQPTLRFGFLWVQTVAGYTTDQDPAFSVTDISITTTTACPISIKSQTSTNPTCSSSNGTITLTATGDPTLTYKISNGTVTDSNTTGAFTGLATGTYTISVTNDTCTQTGTPITLSAGSVKAPTVSSNSPVCAGTTLNLSATDTGTVTYNWAGPGLSGTVTGATPSVTSVTTGDAGTYSVTVTVDGCTATGTTQVTVNPAPTAPTLGPTTSVCAGSTLDLTSTTVAGGTYSWSGPNSFTAAIQDPTRASVTQSDSGWYYLTVTVTGCNPLRDSIFIHIGPGAPTATASNDGPICSNQTLQLQVTTVAGATYHWSGPNSFTSAIYDPTVANITTGDSGVYSVTVTSTCGNSLSSTDVKVVTSPAQPTLSYNNPICIGHTLTLTSSTVPGATYAWSGPSGFNGNTNPASEGNVGIYDSGYYVLTATVPGCGSVTDSIDVSVLTALPAPPIISNNPVCNGDTLTLSTSSYPGANIDWSGPSGVISTDQSTFVADMNQGKAGTYYLNVVSSGCTGIDSLAVTISAIPITKLPSNNYCYGDSAVLDAGPGFASYRWSNGSTDSEIVILEYNTVVYDTLTLTNGNGCTATYSATSVFLPKPDTTTFSQVGSAGDTLVSSWNNALIYQWFFNGDSILNSDHDTLFISQSGNYSVIVTDSNGCSTSSQVQNVLRTGINQIPLSGNLDIYPNPATGVFNIHCVGTFDNDIRMTLYDVIGGKVMDYNYHISSGQVIPVSVGTLASGVYMVRIESQNQYITRKLVIQ